MLALLFAALLGSAALDQAAAELRKSRLDGVVFALEPAVPDGESREAAALLVEAAKLASARKDAALALQLAQMAHRRDAKNAAALEMLGESSLRATELNLAVKYGREWVEAEPGSDKAKRFLARAEELEKIWTPPEISRPKKRLPASRSGYVISPATPRGSHLGANARVILYGTTWCPACNRARGWLTSNKIPFENKDIEKDSAAARELHQKQIRHRLRGRGIPVIDVNGVLLEGFSARSVAAALERTGG